MKKYFYAVVLVLIVGCAGPKVPDVPDYSSGWTDTKPADTRAHEPLVQYRGIKVEK